MVQTLIVFVIKFINILVELLHWSLLIYILLSWFSRKPTVFSNFIGQIVQPILKPFRWARIGMFDLSVIVAMIFIKILGNLIIQIIAKLFIS